MGKVRVCWAPLSYAELRPRRGGWGGGRAGGFRADGEIAGRGFEALAVRFLHLSVSAKAVSLLCRWKCPRRSLPGV